MFLYLLAVLNTLSTIFDDIIPFSFRGRQNFQKIYKFWNKKY
jgi:hypothetical protein